MKRKAPTTLALGILLTAGSLHAAQPTSQEWPAFRGGSAGLAPSLPVQDLSKVKIQQRWKVDTPTGFSSFVVAGNHAYTIVMQDVEGNSTEVLTALDVVSGKVKWEAPLSIIAKYDGGGNDGAAGNKGGDGPRSTPAVSDGKVYTIDANLVVHCVDAATGKVVWTRDVLKENEGVQIKWQNAASPIVHGDVLLMCGGGGGQALLGLNKKTGEVIWKGENDKMTHATPVIANIHGVEQCIFFTQEGLVSVAPATGQVLWRGAFPFRVSSAASPVVYEDVVYCSAGYGVGAGAFQIKKSGNQFEATQIWRRENACFNHWSTPVVKDGYLYGMFSFKQYGNGPLGCVNIKTGEDVWMQEGFGPGQLVLSGDHLVALSDIGEVVFAKADPKGYREIYRKTLMEGKVWSYPVIAYNRLFARSTVEGGCWELK